MYIRFLQDLEKQIRNIPNIDPSTIDRIKDDQITLLHIKDIISALNCNCLTASGIECLLR